MTIEIWIKIIIVISIIFGIYNFIKIYFIEQDSLVWSITMLFATSFLLSVVGVLLLFMLDSVTMSICKTEYREQYTQSLIAIEDSTSIKGTRYAINTGTDIKILVNENGFSRIKNIDANKAYLKETNNISPSIAYYETERTGIAKKILGAGSMYYKYKYHIFIPEGTLTTDYNIDLK